MSHHDKRYRSEEISPTPPCGGSDQRLRKTSRIWHYYHFYYYYYFDLRRYGSAFTLIWEELALLPLFYFYFDLALLLLLLLQLQSVVPSPYLENPSEPKRQEVRSMSSPTQVFTYFRKFFASLSALRE